MKTVVAESYIEVICQCPHCGAVLDIFQMSKIKEVLDKDLRAENIDMELVCTECEKKFIVSDIVF